MSIRNFHKMTIARRNQHKTRTTTPYNPLRRLNHSLQSVTYLRIYWINFPTSNSSVTIDILLGYTLTARRPPTSDTRRYTRHAIVSLLACKIRRSNSKHSGRIPRAYRTSLPCRGISRHLSTHTSCISHDGKKSMYCFDSWAKEMHVW